MRGFSNLLTATLAITGTAASTWFPGTRGIYNKWHETELERWLSDHGIPHPTSADRKDFQSLVEENWNDYVTEPYKKWDREQLNTFLKSRGQDIKDDASDSLDGLITQVKANWYTAEKNAAEASGEAKDWILDTWTDSQLKAFCDRNGIPVPNPRHRDTLLQKARLAYSTAAQKLSQTASYPGDWLYETWSDSDLKSWLDTHGYSSPQVTQRNKLISQVRRNSYIAHLKYQDQLSKAKAEARSVYASLTDNILDTWSESQLKKFCDKNGISVPHGTKVNELRALIRKHRAEIMGTNASGQASKAFGAATSNIDQKFAQATDSASLAAQHAFEQAVDKWSQSRLQSYLDSRGIPVPHQSTSEELRALVRKHAHKASTGWTAWTFDDFDRTNIQNYLLEHGNAAAKKAAKKKDATRDELVSAAHSAYSSASTAGGHQYADATSYLAAAATSVKKTAFNEWSESELKAYLDSYGVPIPQGSKIDELKALARKQATYFKYGTSSPADTFAAKVGDAFSGGWEWVSKQLRLGSGEARKQVSQAEEAAAKQAKKLREEL